MATELPLLDQVTIASPCPASWDQMQGNDQVRFCKECRKNVYNFSEMTRAEAEALIVSKEGKLCGRYYRRPDGTTLTRDCPIGVRLVRVRLVRAMCGIAATMLALVGGMIWGRSAAGKSETGVSAIDEGPLARFANWVDPQPKVFFTGVMLMRPHQNLDAGSESSPNSPAEP